MPEVVEAIYEYKPQGPDDLEMQPGNRIEVYERLSPDWARGRNVSNGKEGVFPTNYVKSTENKQGGFNRPAAQIPQNSGPQPFDEKSSYNAPPSASWQQQQQQQPQYQYQQQQQQPPPQYQYQQPPQQYQYQQPPQQYQQQPPPQQQQPQQQPQPQEQHRRHHFLGNAAQRFGDSMLFGAGATFGSDIINKIF